MRTISLRENDIGEWFISVFVAPNNACISHVAYPSRAQAFRAFIVEGREQPFARMTVRTMSVRREVTVRIRQRVSPQKSAYPLRMRDLLDSLGLHTVVR